MKLFKWLADFDDWSNAFEFYRQQTKVISYAGMQHVYSVKLEAEKGKWTVNLYKSTDQ